MINVRAESFVFLVDDDANERQQLEKLVLTEGWRAEAHATLDEFNANQDPQRAGCLVLMLRPHKPLAREALAKIARGAPGRPVIVLTTEPNYELAVDCFRDGAVDMFLLPLPTEIFLSRVLAANKLDLAQRQHYRQWSDVSQRLARLTPPELEVVKLLTEGMLNKQIAARLNVAVRTIELRRANIFRKMEVASLGDLLRLVIFLELYPHGPQGD